MTSNTVTGSDNMQQVGLGICYDLRFPELSQALQRNGAHILTYPSAFTVATGAAHWEVIFTNDIGQKMILYIDKPNKDPQFLPHSAGASSGESHRDTVLRPSSSAGWPAPREALFLRPRPRSGPLGGGAEWLWRGEPRLGACGDQHGENQQHQEEHASPGAPQRRCFLPQPGLNLSPSVCVDERIV